MTEIRTAVTEFLDELCRDAAGPINPLRALDEFALEHETLLYDNGFELARKQVLRQIKRYLTGSSGDTVSQLKLFDFPRTLTVAADGAGTFEYVPLRIATIADLDAHEAIKAENLRRVAADFRAEQERNDTIRRHARHDAELILDVAERIELEEPTP